MDIHYDFHHAMLRRVKNTFHRMTFTCRHFTGRKTNHAMIAINNSPEMGHRDAACDSAALLLCGHLFALTPEKRLDVYRQAMELLSIATGATLEIFNSSSGNRHEHEGNVLNFLNLLGDTVHAAATLLSHQQTMVEEDGKTADFFGFDLAFHFQNTDEVLADSEINIMQCVREMLDRSHDRMMQYRGHCCRTLSARELKRYHKAFAEYQQLYAVKYPLPVSVAAVTPELPGLADAFDPDKVLTPERLQKTEKLIPRT